MHGVVIPDLHGSHHVGPDLATTKHRGCLNDLPLSVFPFGFALRLLDVAGKRCQYFLPAALPPLAINRSSIEHDAFPPAVINRSST